VQFDEDMVFENGVSSFSYGYMDVDDRYMIIDEDVHLKEKIWNCPACRRPFLTKAALYEHVYNEHGDIIPEHMSVAQYCFNIRNKKSFSLCVQCRTNKTEWDEKAERYSRYCSPECLKRYVVEAKRRMVQTYGRTHILDDPNHQLKMQDSRSISGQYTFTTDKVTVPYMGTYELDFLEYLDITCEWKGASISRCPHYFPYEYNSEKHIYIPDYYVPNFNLIVEVKDTTSTHPHYINIDKVKELSKEKVIRTQKDINYIKVVNKDYKQFAFIIKFIGNLIWDDPEFKDKFNGIIIIPD
jgi:hypothetical protein